MKSPGIMRFFTTSSARAVTCSSFDEPARTIVSELQVDVDACIGYGQNNHPQSGSCLRSAKNEWAVFTGYNSIQNRLRLVSADPTPFTPRFHCDTTVKRCYYPNLEEAGL